MNLRGLAEGEAWSRLQKWNRRNRPPLDEVELNHVLRSGCADPITTDATTGYWRGSAQINQPKDSSGG
ncbi:MAG: primase C-terminal domain-containing protein [Candidatus Bathyarchaeia archaeon]